jgi:hypothetical protein
MIVPYGCNFSNGYNNGNMIHELFLCYILYWVEIIRNIVLGPLLLLVRQYCDFSGKMCLCDSKVVVRKVDPSLRVIYMASLVAGPFLMDCFPLGNSKVMHYIVPPGLQKILWQNYEQL